MEREAQSMHEFQSDPKKVCIKEVKKQLIGFKYHP